ncbi:Rad17 cell cycle checkpoint protein-domain-containing protein [Aspergillus welwitschiae]|uniref:Rad17 cell cycle checkpoint protein-domain-containing protein n=1 Tax=Aspergillus welwitschiae TaxID=1341132 RepID=A0A3F3PQF5_9EURO|nr:Rad17 cell cycle checkpoint protein-domain-containing protein [Aspergillus welwitschiae]RDH29165.1 Rad17 cell cycle checkpoint protein-domain-containing protein [Aspergillus welwitschiae]
MKRKHPVDATTTKNSLHSFYGPANLKQQLPAREIGERQNSECTDGTGSSNEIIEDDYDSFDEIFTRHITFDTDTLADGWATPLDQDVSTKTPQPRPRSAGMANRFLISTEQPKSRSHSLQPGHRTLPWAQQFAPSSIEELAVHQKKVSDVKSWLISTFARRERQLLVLRGPAGSGKTATVSLLSAVLNFDILEWKNPSSSESATKAHVSIASRFDEFLERGNEFKCLDLEEVASSPGLEDNSINAYASRHRIILIEEFPTLTGSASGLIPFRLALLRYLDRIPQQNINPETDVQRTSPIVLVVSETLLNSRSFPSDSLTAHRLLGPVLYNHPKTSILDFNSIAPTYMYKALHLVLEKEARLSKRERFPGPAILHNISTIGDIRSAISSLEFVCMNSGGFKKFPPPKTKNSKGSSIPLTPLERETLDLITQREASLGLFHAVGKIMYNKRVDAGSTEDAQVVLPPDYLSHHKRPQLSQVCVNELVDEAGTDNQTFISALHENYVPSCNGPSFTDYLDGCIGALSDSDMLSFDTRGRSKFGLAGVSRYNSGSDSLRQEDLSYQVATRGILFALPSPVKRSAWSNNGSNHTRSAYKMLFPASLRLLRDMEEIQDLIDIWSAKLLDPSISGFKPEGAASLSDSCSKPTVAVTMMSRSDLILHQLPYLALIAGDFEQFQGLHRLTKLSGTKNQSDANDFEMLDYQVELPSIASTAQWKSLPTGSSSRTSRRYHSNAFGPQLPPSLEKERLFLADDDIVDDY